MWSGFLWIQGAYECVQIIEGAAESIIGREIEHVG